MFPRFTLRELFYFTTLLTLGLAGLCIVFRTTWTRNELVIAVPILTGSVTALVAGICAPFQEKLLGALLGFLASLPLALVLILAH